MCDIKLHALNYFGYSVSYTTAHHLLLDAQRFVAWPSREKPE